MHAVVSIKQVPDTAEVRIDPRTNTMIRAGVPSIVNPEDVHAIEEAVHLAAVGSVNQYEDVPLVVVEGWQ